MVALSEAIGKGSFDKLQELRLENNQIGDKGLRHLASALERGAAPLLRAVGREGGLLLDGNSYGAAGLEAVERALQAR